ncbi:MAG: hypothetical protein J5629_01240 [Muribaculaceae bacterium]|nr:hypothetical protein [Muribaculaceae bacterium]
MKKIFLLALMAGAVMTVNARVNTPTPNRVNNDAEIETVMADAKLKFEQGSNDVFKLDDNTMWRNGMYDCSASCYYDKNDIAVGKSFYLNCANDEKLLEKHKYDVKLVKGQPVVVNKKGVTVKHQVAGRWDMLVFRDANGAVLDVALLKQENYTINDEECIADLKDMINGVYAGTGKNSGDTVVFGPNYGYDRSFLPGADYRMEYRYNSDGSPVINDFFHVVYYPERMKRVHMPEPSKKIDENGETHYYADGKEVSRDEYEFLLSRPTGYKGHASLHGPLMWKVKPQGNDLAVELSEPFQEELDAFYSNFRDEKFTLKWVRSPYKGMKDRWAVLSMRPVTRGMLALCDKATLKQMLKYLNARKTPTDIEKLNKSLINTMVKEL